ncbi:hypothetical protein DKX38_018725 [Salix brachista]|uniref:Homeobox domain-containing protein n=1 Tax=Salix brachista TaxID=2182728 RepID=A0A5N5KNT0_9ROSI|nr:hypothetical protein DKX38_018725 [Salix brachista]
MGAKDLFFIFYFLFFGLFQGWGKLMRLVRRRGDVSLEVSEEETGGGLGQCVRALRRVARFSFKMVVVLILYVVACFRYVGLLRKRSIGYGRNNVNGFDVFIILPDEAAGSSDEDGNGGEADVQDCSRINEDRELKDKLLRKYSGYIGTLKHAFSKQKKKGKLPKEARQILLNWWNIHNKWPYPTENLGSRILSLNHILLFFKFQEADKVALAESTGLDQKQINNWFINQRKRHWKPSENMQFSVVDSLYGPFFMND